MREYIRPLLSVDRSRPVDAVPLAGGWTWFTHVQRLSRDAPCDVCHVSELDEDQLANLTAPRADLGGVSLNRPRVLGVLNITPDSFSDGGDFRAPDSALSQAKAMREAGMDWVDLGAESSRPGSSPVSEEDERARLAPVLSQVAALSPLSIDTRKAAVAELAFEAGAVLVNDVSAMAFDPEMVISVVNSSASVCLMHSQGVPETMQDDPRYEHVLLDVYDKLAVRVAFAEAAGIPRSRIIVDPGIGFGKTFEHNRILLQNLSLLHSLGCAVMVGASRKSFVGRVTGQENPKDRLGGSLAVALTAAAQGVQIHRVHDVAETVQGFRMMSWLWGRENEQE